jgi:hypothetical protein
MRITIQFSIIAALLITSATRAGAEAPATQPASLQESIDKGVKFLEKFQSPDGSWGTGTETRGTEIMSMVPGSLDAFRLGASSLCVMALREAGEKTAHDKGLEYLLTAKDAKRDDGQLIYNTWAHIYVLQAMSEEILAGNKDPRIVEVAKRNLKEMVDYATYLGGWAYYDFDSHTQPVSMGPTSFGTAAGLVTLFEAKQAGLEVPEKLVTLSMHSLERCRLPNGVFLYGTDYKYIPTLPANRPQGAVGRTQPANYALWLWKSKESNQERITAGLDLFFKDHKFLDMGRKRPFPHESWYQTSGYYYYFDHYYASRLLEALDAGEAKKEYAKQIAANVVPHQEEDGSWWDYAMWDFHKPYGTAFAIMTLLRCKPSDFEVDQKADSVVFVIEENGEIGRDLGSLRAVLRAIDRLGDKQSFDIIKSGQSMEVMSPSMLNRTPAARSKVQEFFSGASTGGTHRTTEGIEKAMEFHPAAIYYISDWDLYPEDLDRIRKVNEAKRTHINTVLFFHDNADRHDLAVAEQSLKRAASENGGKFQRVDMDSVEP